MESKLIRLLNIQVEMLFVFLGCLLISTSGAAQEGKDVFKKNCTACHTVGGGRLVGPDLKGVTSKRSEEWLAKFIKSSQALIKSGDADAKAIFEEYSQITMPDQAISDAEIKSVILYIKSQSPVETAETEVDNMQVVSNEPVKPQRVATEQDIMDGLNLFAGKKIFNNKGPSCLSCHNVTYDGIMGGGLLAKDLTTVYERMGEAGIGGLLNAPPFPAMAESYKNNPLSEDEIFQLTAFLNHVNKERLYQHNRDYASIFYFGGGLGLTVLLITISIVWFNRKKRSVKHDIFKRQLDQEKL